MSSRTIVYLILMCSFVSRALAGSFAVEASINGHPVELALRTSQPGIVLYREVAALTGLPLRTGINAPGRKVTYWSLEDCPVTLHWSAFNKTVLTTRVDVIELPANYPPGFVGPDGFVGWGTIADNILEIDAETSSFRFLAEVPEKVHGKGWVRASVRTNQPAGQECLILELPDAHGKKISIAVDTGLDSGVGLPPRQWLAWDKANPNVPRTLCMLATGEGKILDIEQGWAATFDLGPLALTGVIIEEADPSGRARLSWTNDVVMGTSALRRLELIVDGSRGVAYLHPKKRGPSRLNHNRLGAIFLPSEESGKPIAIVAENSPAYNAGIRYGDVLVSFDGRHVEEVNRWELMEINNRLSSTMAGTKDPMVLRRGDKTFEVRPALRNILPPGK